MLLPLQAEGGDQAVYRLLPGGFVLYPHGNVLGHRHVGEEGVILEEIAYFPLLRGQVNATLRVEEYLIIQHNAAPVGFFDPGDALEGEALAAAGGTQQAGDLAALCLKGAVQPEFTEVFVNVNL